jgi:hypothetical protein
MPYYLASYRPMATTGRGRASAKAHGLPLFIDGSCRREPDLQGPRPSISALCRGKMFAPRLHRGDEVVYITVKSSFGATTQPHRKLVAHLRVVEEFLNHMDAANWYTANGLPVPSNCMVTGSAPEPYQRTYGHGERKYRAYTEEQRLTLWDGGYRKRARENGSFLACETLLCDTQTPLRLHDEDILAVFNRIPGTETPPAISQQQLQSLLTRAHARGA